MNVEDSRNAQPIEQILASECFRQNRDRKGALEMGAVMYLITAMSAFEF